MVVGELVLEGEWGWDGEGCRKVRGEGGEGCGGEGVEGDDAGLASGVEEGVGAWKWDYVATIAAHYAELRAGWRKSCVHGARRRSETRLLMLREKKKSTKQKLKKKKKVVGTHK